MRVVIQGVAILLCFLASLPSAAGATKTSFDKDGHCLVDGKRFFPIGCRVYGLDSNVLADLHEHGFDTVCGGGLNPRHVKICEEHVLMMIPMESDEFLKAAK